MRFVLTMACLLLAAILICLPAHAAGNVDGRDVIDGTVKDAATGKPVKGAIVEIKNANLGVGYYRLTTDSMGYFRVDDFIRHLRYRIDVTADGYVTCTRTEKIESGTYHIELQKEGILSGLVKDSSGRPVQGVEVRLNPGGRRQPREDGEEGEDGRVARPLITSTAGDGSYSFKKLKQGPSLVTFRKEGYIAETLRVENVRSGETVNLPLVMYRPARISGKVLVEGLGIPAPDIDVAVQGAFNYSTVTYHDGTYSIGDIKPGTYYVRLNHRGFHALERSGVAIGEGDELRGNDFIVKPKDASIEVYTSRYTFVPGQPVVFDLKTLRLEKVRAILYSVPIREMLHGQRSAAVDDPVKRGFKIVRQWEESIKDFKPYEYRSQSIEVMKAVPLGSYCIEVTDGDKVRNRKFFSVTSIGVVVKRSSNNILVYATDLIKNRPMPGVSITAFERTPSKPVSEHQLQSAEGIALMNSVARGKTDKDGVYRAKVDSGRNLTVLATSNDAGYAFCDSGAPGGRASEKKRLFIYTDRPVYRAGDKVHYKVVGKSSERTLVPMKGESIHYQIHNMDAEKIVDSGEFTLDEWGTYGGSVTLAAGMGLGEYEIKAGPTPDSLFASGRFYVEQYRKPEFRIDIAPSKRFFVNRDTLEFKVDAKYFFGSPLKGALVRYRFFEARLRDAGTRYWWEEDSPATPASTGRLKLEGEKYLDANGVAVLKLSAGNFPYDREITLEATIVDGSNASVSSRSTVRVGRGEFYLKIDPVRQFFGEGEKKMIRIASLAHDGTPVSAAVNIKVYRYIWKASQMVYLHDSRPVMERQINTDKQGRGTLELPDTLQYYGEYDIVAEGKDQQDNMITASRVVWIYGRGSSRVDSRFKNLELAVSDPRMEKPGEVTCLIKSRFADAHVLLTIEGKDIHESRVVKMHGNMIPVKLDIRSTYAPNVFIVGTLQKGRALYSSSVSVSLPAADTSLSIKMTPDKAKYLPGERVTMNISVANDAGRPVAADLSLGVVDEAIYQIRPDHTPNIREFFYSKISNWVLTNYSYTFTVLAGAAKEGKVKIREKFADTAFWKADIRTNERGQAFLSFNVPDNLTTWRLTARGHDLEGRAGERKGEILVTQDLIARIGKPRFFTRGDTISLIGMINNNTERGLESVETLFKVNDRKIIADERTKISLPAFGSTRTFYTIKVPEDRENLTLFFQAISKGPAKDALRMTLPVLSSGANYSLFGVGDMASHQTVELQPPRNVDEFEFKPDELILTVNPSPVLKLIKASRFLAEYPYGCAEQTINRFLPVLALKALLKQKGMEHLISDAELADKAAVGLKRLQDMQNADGTWGWWGGDSASGFLTGYALYALYVAKTLGYTVNQDTVDSGLVALSGMVDASALMDSDQRAYLIYVGTLWGKWDPRFIDEFAADRNLNAYQMSFAIRTMAEARKRGKIQITDAGKIDKQVADLVAKLKTMRRADALGVYWDSPHEYYWGWQGRPAEISAHVLSALVESKDRSALPSQIVQSLSKRSRGDGWYSTKETATILFAVGRYLEETTGGVSRSGDLSFVLNGGKIASFHYDMSNLKEIASLTKTVKIKVPAKGQVYRVQAKGTAGSDTSFDLTLKGHLYFKRGLFSIFRSEETGIRSLGNGLSLSRTFYLARRVTDINNNEFFVPQEIKTKMVKVGDEVIVRIKFRADDNYQYLVLEDYLPSGFEVVRQTIYADYRPYSRIERWDDKMVFFFTRVTKGEVYELAYTMRAELPGKFTVRPARMECMYEPSIQGWSSPGVFIVEKK